MNQPETAFPREGETLGGYRLRKKVSESLLGTFFSAQDEDNDNWLLMVLPQRMIKIEPRFINKFRLVIDKSRKIKSASFLMPESIEEVESYWAIKYRGTVNVSITNLIINSQTYLPVEMCHRILKEVGEALDDCSRFQLYHHFLTPDFIFLTEEGEARIAGVGIFQSMNYELFERFVSAAISPIGHGDPQRFTALEILSPEIRDSRRPDPRTDFFCLGMCGYYLLTGKKPVRNWILPSEARKAVSKGWDLFISHCLESNPKSRFPHFRAFLKDLEIVDELNDRPARDGGRILRILHRIPLPAKIEETLGLRALFLLRLTLLGVAGIFTIGLGLLLFSILYTEEIKVESTYVVQRSTIDDANIIIKVKPERARVQFTGESAKNFILTDGILAVQSWRGKRQITIESPGYQPEFIEIDLIDVENEPITRTVELRPDYVDLRIKTQPRAKVYAISRIGSELYVGETDENGLLEFQNRLLSGDHGFRIVCNGYEVWMSERLEISGGEFELIPDLVAIPGQVVIRSEPTKAKVFLGEKFIGRTPILVEGLTVGETVAFKIKKEKYRAVEKEFQITPGSEFNWQPEPLELEVGEVTIDLSLAGSEASEVTSEGVSVSIDGDTYTGNWPAILPVGKHELIVSHIDFYPATVSFELTDLESKALAVQLEPKPGKLEIRIPSDSPARYWINGTVAEAGENGRFSLKAGEVTVVELVIRDHLNVRKEFVAKPNETIVWEVPLEKIPGPVTGEEWKMPYFDLPMVWIPAGKFVMGSEREEPLRLPNEDNRTHMRINHGFWIGRFEVTQAVYDRLTGENPSRYKGARFPVDSVPWDDAISFVERLNQFEGRAGRLPAGYIYRLPTEAEWEYAARAGTQTPFSFGDQADATNGNFKRSYPLDENTTTGDGTTHYGSMAVGQFPANDWGLYDVHGNVAEWVFDVYWDRLPGGVLTDYVRTSGGRGRSVRGGSWQDPANRVRSAARSGLPEKAVRDTVGFRLVLAPEITK